MRLLVDSQLCTGCRTCEVVCTFHHTGAMGTGPSSLHISKSNHTAEIGWRVDSTCDGCAGENGALCIKYCHLGAIRLNGAGPPKGAPAPPDGPATRFGGPTTRPETAT